MAAEVGHVMWYCAAKQVALTLFQTTHNNCQINFSQKAQSGKGEDLSCGMQGPHHTHSTRRLIRIVF